MEEEQASKVVVEVASGARYPGSVIIRYSIRPIAVGGRARNRQGHVLLMPSFLIAFLAEDSDSSFGPLAFTLVLVLAGL